MQVLCGLLVIFLVLAQANGVWDRRGHLHAKDDERASREMLRFLLQERRNSQLNLDARESGDASLDSNEASKRGSEVSIDQYRQQALDQHNVYRRKHCAPDMTLDPELNDIAQKYAEKLAATNSFQHSGNKFNGEWMGENLYMTRGSQAANGLGSAPVIAWYSEITRYNFDSPGYIKGTGHFTQVVWKSSTRLGIGRGISSNGRSMYTVANYFPGGNIQGDFADNVERTPC